MILFIYSWVGDDEVLLLKASRVCMISEFGGIASGPPQVEAVRIRLSTLSGFIRASSWAIIEPIEIPNISAFGKFSWSSRPVISFANWLIENSLVPKVVSPAPRLSNMITLRFEESSFSTDGYHISIVVQQPIIKTIGMSLLFPSRLYAMIFFWWHFVYYCYLCLKWTILALTVSCDGQDRIGQY